MDQTVILIVGALILLFVLYTISQRNKDVKNGNNNNNNLNGTLVPLVQLTPEEQAATAAGYTFFQSQDNPVVLSHAGTTDLLELVNICNTTDNCTGFNTNGYLKSGTIQFQSAHSSFAPIGKGLWMKV